MFSASLGVRRSITDIFVLNHHCYGYRRLWAAGLADKAVRHLL